jgi:hypothetical protein
MHPSSFSLFIGAAQRRPLAILPLWEQVSPKGDG